MWTLAVVTRDAGIELYDTYQGYFRGLYAKDEAIASAALFTVEAFHDDYGVLAYIPVPLPFVGDKADRNS